MLSRKWPTVLSKRGIILAAILAGLILLAPSGPSRPSGADAASATVEKVVAVGDPAPSGGTFSDLTSGAPVAHLNSTGGIAFWGDTTVTAPSAQLGDGIFLASPVVGAYSVTKIAHVGDSTPVGGTFIGFGRSPSLNDSGQVAFVGAISGGAGDIGVFVAFPAFGGFDIAKVAVVGDATPVGGSFGSLGSWYDPSLSDDGKVAFSAPVSGGAAPQGVWLASPTMSGFQLQKVAFAGDATPAGGTFDNFGYQSPTLNSVGEVAFVADINGSAATFGLFLASPELDGFNVAKVVAGGDGAPIGGTFNGLNGFGLNDSGQMAFTGQVVGTATGAGVFVATASIGGFAINTVAATGDATPIGGSFNSFGSVFLTGSNEVTFRALVSGANSNDGVFLASPSATGYTSVEVSVAGDNAPTGGTFSSFGNFPSANGDGDVVFAASVSGGSAPSGIFLSSPVPVSRTWGDVDCDSQFNAVDALKLLRYTAGLSIGQAEQCLLIGATVTVNGTTERIWGDVDCSGAVDAVDALKALRFVAGLPSSQAEGCPTIGITVSVS